MTKQPIQIDRAKLHSAIRKLRNESVFHMLDDAIELLSPTKLLKMVKKHLDVEQLRLDAEPMTPRKLLTDVQRFRKASLAGEYYESFMVNSKNYREKSAGTRAWIAEYRRLVDRCGTSARESHLAEIREAMDILFGLLDHIDECHDDVIFFADEGGSWQVGVDWVKVLPIYFKVLSATAQPQEYAERVSALVSRHYSHGRDKMLAIARRAATLAQRKALAVVKIG